eukprot:m.32751 g.32751  ORF g.32751 m.32751 type:complete len:386 (+) comp31690_c0_seq3:24-1181(+)
MNHLEAGQVKRLIKQKSYACDEEGCEKSFTTASHLKAHKRIHSGEKPFVCSHSPCQRAFTTSYGLKTHERTHTGDKPYACDFDGCSKAFKTSGDLRKHKRTHTGERPFSCKFEGCRQSFSTSSGLRVHERTHTGEKPYRCTADDCQRTFTTYTSFLNHFRLHTGEKPHVCSHPGCEKRFTEYSSLFKHQIVHKKDRPYRCTDCGKMYRQVSSLHQHRRTVHALNLHAIATTTETTTEEIVEMPSPDDESVAIGDQSTWPNAYLSDSVRTVTTIPITVPCTSSLVPLSVESASHGSGSLSSSPLDFPLMLNWAQSTNSADDLSHACLAFDTGSGTQTMSVDGVVPPTSTSVSPSTPSPVQHLLGGDTELTDALGLEMSSSSPFDQL